MSSFSPLILGLSVADGGPEALRRSMTDRVAVVTGASHGIGRELAYRLTDVGATVIGVARDEPALAAIQKQAEDSFHPLRLDLRDTDAATQAARQLVARWGTPALLISNAGHSIHRYLPDYTHRFHDIARTAAVNYLGAVAFALPILGAMMDAGRGQLLSVSSTSADVPMPGWSAYTASKGAYELWLASVAPELAARGVSATSVHLPRVATAMSAPTAGHYPVPELTVAQAASVICRAIVRRPREVAPWWARAARLASASAPASVNRLWAAALRRGIHP